MNVEVKGVTSAIRNKLIKHHTTVDMVMADFRGEMESARKDAAKFKNEKEELRTRQAKAASAARAKIAEADKELADSIKNYYIPKLQGFVKDHIAERPPRAFLDLLAVYKDFNLTMERGELDNLLLLSEGNFVAMKALSATAKACGWSVSEPSIEAYQKQIAELDMLTHTPIQYCSGAEYFPEAELIYENAKKERTDGKGFFFTNAPMTTTDLIISVSRHRRLLDHLEAMGDEWAAAFVPEISSLDPIKTDSGDTVTVEQQHAYHIQEAIGLADIKKDVPLRSTEILEEYTTK